MNMGRDSGDSQLKPTSHKRKASRRRLVESDEEELPGDAADLRLEAPRVKRARTAESDQTPTVHNPNNADHDMDVDIDGELDAAAIDEETRFLVPDAINQHTAPLPSVAPSQARKKGKVEVSGKRLKKADPGGEAIERKRAVYSDADDADVDIDDAADEDDAFEESALSFAGAQDDDFEPQPAPKRSVKAKVSSSTKSKTAKVKPVLAKGGKGKAGKEKEKEKEIMIKDERKLPPGSPLLSTSQTQTSDLFADDESSIHPPSAVEHSAAADHSTLQLPEPAKKRKLPTIKKNKQVTSAATSTPSQSATVPSKPPPPSDDTTKHIASANQQRKPAALMGATDFDLRDKSVYAELFKGAGGSTPRSGLNRREKEEERRKELNKMRDEAKAKRAEEAKHFFDLQSQADKIARFEQNLRARNGMALHPNFLAAKFREEYDRDRMRQRQSREGSQDATKEEGEA